MNLDQDPYSERIQMATEYGSNRIRIQEHGETNEKFSCFALAKIKNKSRKFWACWTANIRALRAEADEFKGRPSVAKPSNVSKEGDIIKKVISHNNRHRNEVRTFFV